MKATWESEFELVKVFSSGTVSVFFHVYPEKVHVITLGAWRGAGQSAFTVTVEQAREDWKRLRSQGFARKAATR